MRMPRAFAPQASARERGVAVRRPPSERSPVAVVKHPALGTPRSRPRTRGRVNLPELRWTPRNGRSSSPFWRS
jgi:hypothetical protein